MKILAVSDFTFRFLKLAYNVVVDIIAPPFCAYCSTMLEKREVFCSSCQKKILPIVSTTVSVTKTKRIKVLAIGNYEGPLRSLILAKKRSDIIASRQLGQLIWDMTYLCNLQFDFIVPVPLHWTRFARRGFNQAEQMARILSKNSGKPVINIIKRGKQTRYQAGLSHDLRAINVHEAFKISVANMQKFNGKKILLVDDLMTTGATLKTVARQLYKLKPDSITAVVACRVV